MARTNCGRIDRQVDPVADIAAAEAAVLARLMTEPGEVGEASAYGDHPDQLSEVYGRGGERMLMFLHGGFFRPATDRTHARPLARALATAGWEVHLVEYRRIPGAPQASFADLRAFDRAYAPAARPVVWAGHSAGGYLVLWRAAQRDLPPVSVVALAPVADLAVASRLGLGQGAVDSWIGASAEKAPQRYEELAVLPAGASVRTVHGTDDCAVPVSLSDGIQGMRLAGAHHFDVVDPASPFFGEVARALESRVGAAG